LLATVLGGWSGDKWQMEFSMDHRGAQIAVNTAYPHPRLDEHMLIQSLDAQARWNAGVTTCGVWHADESGTPTESMVALGDA